MRLDSGDLVAVTAAVRGDPRRGRAVPRRGSSARATSTSTGSPTCWPPARRSTASGSGRRSRRRTTRRRSAASTSSSSRRPPGDEGGGRRSRTCPAATRCSARRTATPSGSPTRICPARRCFEPVIRAGAPGRAAAAARARSRDRAAAARSPRCPSGVRALRDPDTSAAAALGPLSAHSRRTCDDADAATAPDRGRRPERLLPGGALGVAGGDRARAGDRRRGGAAGTVVATRDLHPADHRSFAEQGGPGRPLRPGDAGAELHPSVAGLPIDRVQDVGVEPDARATRASTAPISAHYLRGRGVTARARDRDRHRLLRAGHGARRDPGGLRDDRADRRGGRRRRRARRRRVGRWRRSRAAGGALDRVALLRDEAALEPILERKADAAARGGPAAQAGDGS